MLFSWLINVVALVLLFLEGLLLYGTGWKLLLVLAMLLELTDPKRRGGVLILTSCELLEIRGGPKSGLLNRVWFRRLKVPSVTFLTASRSLVPEPSS